jgi:hypothetical protein
MDDDADDAGREGSGEGWAGGTIRPARPALVMRVHQDSDSASVAWSCGLMVVARRLMIHNVVACLPVVA